MREALYFYTENPKTLINQETNKLFSNMITELNKNNYFIEK
jgi:hypothetical protein